MVTAIGKTCNSTSNCNNMSAGLIAYITPGFLDCEPSWALELSILGFSDPSPKRDGASPIGEAVFIRVASSHLHGIY